MKLIQLLVLLLCSAWQATSALAQTPKKQQPVPVAERTVKISALNSETMHYGFAPGDTVLFSIDERHGKPLAAIKVSGKNDHVLFEDVQTFGTGNRSLVVPEGGVLSVRIENNAIWKRICNVSISRIPAHDTLRPFNTGVVWETRYDTAWQTRNRVVTVGYDTIYKPILKKVLARVDTELVEVLTQTERIHSQLALNGKNHWQHVTINLPQQEYTKYRTRTTLCWVYWLGEGESAAKSYKAAIKSGIQGVAKLANFYPEGGPLISLALNGVAQFVMPDRGNSIDFEMSSHILGNRLVLAHGNSVASWGRMDRIKRGSFTLRLVNNNLTQPVDVHLRFAALMATKHYKDITETKVEYRPIRQTQTERTPLVRKKRVAVCAGNPITQ